jgi:hypothetical protein
VAIDIEWQDERGEVLARYEGPALTWKALEGAPGGSCLSYIDPAGDTTFNQLQIPDLLLEMSAFAERTQNPTLRGARFRRTGAGHESHLLEVHRRLAARAFCRRDAETTRTKRRDSS